MSTPEPPAPGSPGPEPTPGTGPDSPAPPAPPAYPAPPTYGAPTPPPASPQPAQPYGQQPPPGHGTPYGQPSPGQPGQPGQHPQPGQPGQYAQPGQAGQYPQHGEPGPAGARPGWYAATGAPVQQEDPGKTLGIVGFVVAFLGPLSIVGLVLSIVALVKSRKAGFGNGFAVAGIIVGGVVLLLSIVGAILLAVFLGTGIDRIVELCGDVPSGTVVQDGSWTVTCP